MEYINHAADMLPDNPEFAEALEYFAPVFDFAQVEPNLYSFKINDSAYLMKQDDQDMWVVTKDDTQVACGKFPVEAVYKTMWPECRVVPVSAGEIRMGDMLALRPFGVITSEPLPIINIVLSTGVVDAIESGIDESDGTFDEPSPELTSYLEAQKALVDFIREPLTQETTEKLFNVLIEKGISTEVPKLSELEVEIDYTPHVASILQFGNTACVETILECLDDADDLYTFDVDADENSKIWVVRR